MPRRLRMMVAAALSQIFIIAAVERRAITCRRVIRFLLLHCSKSRHEQLVAYFALLYIILPLAMRLY